MGKAIIIDGNSLIYRIYYGSQGRNDEQTAFKEFFKTLYSLKRSIQRIVDVMGEDCEYAVVVFDTTRDTFRKRKFDEYKSKRSSMPSPLFHNLNKVHQVFEDQGFVVVLAPDCYEGDDAAATISRLFSKSGITTGVFSTDKDLLQLVDQNVSVYLFKNREWKKNDIHNFSELNDGILPHQIPDQKALSGDSSDNYKGLPGIGPVTANKWLKEYGSIRNIYSKIHELPEKHQNILSENREQLNLFSELARLVYDLDLPKDLNHYKKYAKA